MEMGRLFNRCGMSGISPINCLLLGRSIGLRRKNTYPKNKGSKGNRQPRRGVHNQTLAKPEPLALYSGGCTHLECRPQKTVLSEGRGACNNLKRYANSMDSRAALGWKPSLLETTRWW